jgi:RNA polymerase sigma factor (sigma-70 family)
MNQNMLKNQYIEHLYLENKQWLYAWLYQKLGSADRAEDVLHDAFAKLLKQKNLLKIEQPKAFLTTVAKRVMIDRSRHQKIEQAYLLHLAQQSFADEISPERMLMAVQLLELLEQLLTGLPERAQKIFVWHYIDACPLNVIAERLAVSNKTVYNDLVSTLIYVQKNANFSDLDL